MSYRDQEHEHDQEQESRALLSSISRTVGKLGPARAIKVRLGTWP
jgi:hypothetical protein